MTLRNSPITEPGIYPDIPIDRYHYDTGLLDGPSISSSGLRLIDAQTPAHYWAQSPYNPERTAPMRNDALELGIAAHWLLLGENQFRKRFVISEYPDFRTKAAREWRDDMREQGRIVIRESDIAIIQGMAKSLALTPEISDGLFGGAIEQSLFWKDKATGIWLRSRPDVVPKAAGMLVDLKTTTDASPRACQRVTEDLGYSIQAYLAGRGMEVLTGTKITDFLLVFVEKQPPYAVSIWTLSGEWLQDAGERTHRALRTFKNCLDSGEWPGWGPPRTMQMPPYLRNIREYEISAGLREEISHE